MTVFALLLLAAAAPDTPINELRPDGLVLDWVTLGPFPTRPLAKRLPDGVSRSGYHTDYLQALGGEAKAAILPATAIDITTPEGNKRTVRAQRIGPKHESEKLPLFNHILEERHIIEEDYNQAVGYGFCYLKSDREQKVFGYFTFNDSPKVWLNGKLIHHIWEDERQGFQWQDGMVLELKQGLNPLLIKIDNQRGYWGFELMAYEAQHHMAAVKRYVRRVQLQDVKTSGRTVNCRAVLDPKPVGVDVQLRVEVKDQAGRVIASGTARTGVPASLDVPGSYNGLLHLAVSSADPLLADLRGATAAVWIGDFSAAIRNARTRYSAASKNLGFLPSEWRRIYAVVMRWLDRFFESTAPADPWAISTLQYSEDLAAAIAQKRNFIAEHPGAPFPVAFESAGRQGQYHIYLPAGFDPKTAYPLMIDLHGSSRMERKITFNEPLNVSYVGTYVQLDGPAVIGATPISPEPRSGWDTDYLNAFLSELKKSFPIDANRVYMQGGSMGGQGAWDWAVSNPEHFAAIAPRCAFDGHPFRAVRLKDVPAWVFNGEKDLASIAFEPEIMVTAMRRAGGSAELWQFPHLGHSFGENIDKRALKKWYLRHTRSPEPAPPDPQAAIRSGEITGIIDIPAKTVFTLRERERLDYPQDNLYRAAVKLFQAYRKPHGITPLRLADGTFQLRSLDFGQDGPIQMLLDPPAGVPAVAEGELETVSLPPMKAAKVFFQGTWEEMARRKSAIYRELDAQGHRRSGEERTLVHVVRSKQERRIFELLIGLAPSGSFQSLLQPAPKKGGFSMDGYWVWCGSTIKAPDGRYHMFASRWPKQFPFFEGYIFYSEVVRASAEKPEGPYRFEEVVLPARGAQFWDGRMTHNPTVHKAGDTYLLFYIGGTYSGPGPSAEELRSGAISTKQAYASIRIGVATAKSLNGPWVRRDKAALEPRPGKWDGSIVTNPAALVMPDGSILLVYRSNTPQGLRLGVARAMSVDGLFERISDEPVFTLEGGNFVEDPFIWSAGDHFEMIAKDMTGGITGEHHAGVHAVSNDGIHWKLSPHPKAYSRTVLWDDGSVTTQGSFERPQLLIEGGRPTHLFAATADGPGGFRAASNTWNMVIPLR